MNARPCGADTLVRETLEPKITKGGATTLVEGVVHAFTLLVSTLREIFDEAAYDRFLERGNLTSSVASYARFRHECDQARARRPRCC